MSKSDQDSYQRHESSGLSTVRYVEGGPDIPLAIVQAQEEGRLVLFCGAGISLSNDFPLFQGLVDLVGCRLGVEKTSEEQLEYERENYDRVFSLLEREERYGQVQIRSAVNEILKTPDAPSLDTHAALIDLATTRTGGAIRLVTTNFDLLFEKAAPEAPVDCAPKLPVPKPGKWNSLVHLHGRIDVKDQSAGSLVLSSADFGTAYLVERWASRFVSELFQHFTVLFVGYSAEDPVMRYLLDALASERQINKNVKNAYALVGCAASEIAEKERAWRSKNVEPITYDSAAKHAILTKTLREWARIYKGGANAKLSIVREIGSKSPQALPQQERDKFLWAVSDESGIYATEFANLEPRAGIGWLEVLDKAGIFADLGGQQVTDHSTLPAKVTHALALWLAGHGDSPRLFQWILKRRGWIHANLARVLRIKLEESAWPDFIRKAWRLLLGGRVCGDSHAFWRLPNRAEKEEWSRELRMEVLDALEPCLAATEPWSRFFRMREEDHRASSVADLVQIDCELRAGDLVRPLLDKLRARGDWGRVLSEMALDLSLTLRRAIDLLGAGGRGELSSFEHPSIEPHGQNRMHHGWTYLVDLTREAVELLGETDPEKASTLVGVWEGIDSGVFRRLILHAARVVGVPDGRAVLKLIQGNPTGFLWAIETQVELFPLLRALWPKLSKRNRTALARLILKGPPEGTFRSDADESDVRRYRDKMVWERLVRIARCLPPLEGRAKSQLKKLQDKYPGFRYEGERREDFSTWIEATTGLETDYTGEQMLQLSPEERLSVLTERSYMCEGRLETWETTAAGNPDDAIEFLGYLSGRGKGIERITRVWMATLQALGRVRDLAHMESFLKLMIDLPKPLLRMSTYPGSDALREFAKDDSPEVENLVLRLWPKLLTASVDEAIATVGSDELTAVSSATL